MKSKNDSQASFDEGLCQAFQQWKETDQELDQRFESIRDWMIEVGQLGIPRFGETATRLQPLVESLAILFENENTIANQLAKAYPQSLRAISAVKRQCFRDHDQLKRRLDDLISRLQEIEPPFASWNLAYDEVSLFIEALHQHEDQESESLHILMPNECFHVEYESAD